MRRDCLFLFVLFKALQLVSSGDYITERNVQGFVGGSVQMRCELKPPYNVNRLYFQKKDKGEEIFINGFDSKELPVRAEYAPRTVVNKTELSLEMFNLSLDDEGDYTCIPFRNSEKLNNQTKFHLTVTANYSVPIISVQGCGISPAAQNCVIACSSSGGFPRSNVTWTVDGDDMSGLLRDNRDPAFIQDTHSRLWNVSHAVTLNCSQLHNITCSVGGFASRAVSVCQPPKSPDIIIPIASAVLLVFSIAVIVAFITCRRTQSTVERATDVELVNLK